MADEVITLELLARLCQQTLQEARALRKEVADVRTLGLQTVEYARRIERRGGEIERRVGEQRDDLELMIKAELSGALANMQTQLRTICARSKIGSYNWTSWKNGSAPLSAAVDGAQSSGCRCNPQIIPVAVR
jgi:hypothetical protein